MRALTSACAIIFLCFICGVFPLILSDFFPNTSNKHLNCGVYFLGF